MGVFEGVVLLEQNVRRQSCSTRCVGGGLGACHVHVVVFVRLCLWGQAGAAMRAKREEAELKHQVCVGRGICGCV